MPAQRRMRLSAHLHATGALAVLACTSPSAPRGSDPGPTACAGRRDTTKVPLGDLGTGCYLGLQGGLYLDGSSDMPADHLAAGTAAAAQIRPLDVNGAPSAAGRIVLLSVGMSNATQEFCSESGTLGSCDPWSFMGQAAADSAVNRSTLVLVDGARGGQTASSWVSATSPEYDRIRDQWLGPLGLSERQVQAAWVKVANAQPTRSLPDMAADAYLLEREIGQIARALKLRYPNLRQIFLSSRIYAGYARTTLNPEPYAYESAFAVRGAIAAQIAQARGTGVSPRDGDLGYGAGGPAAWMAWGPYMWAAGTTPRSDGLTWSPSDFASDGTHPAQSARRKVGAMLLSFFRSSTTTRCWFLAGQRCG